MLGLTSIRVSADTPDRPAIAFNRWAEDWSVLADPDVPREPLDELKYIQLSNNDAGTYLSFGANIRERFEVNNTNFGTRDNQRDSYLLSRTEAHLDLRIHSQVQMFFQLQSDLSPGKQRPTPVDQDRLGIEQGFIALSEPLGDGVVAIRIGRQENGFDLQRFLSVRDGPNVRQSYDGVSVAYTRGPWRFITLYTEPVQNRNSALFADYSSPHLSLGLVRIERQVTSSSSISAYVGQFRQGDARFPGASGTERCTLVEVRYTGGSGRFDWDAEAMSQNGRIGAQTIRAWATGAVVGRTFGSTRFRPRISLQFDAASGDKSPTDHQLDTFNPLFPSGHYFTTAGYTTYANLVHVKTDLSVNPLTNVKLSSGIGVEWRETVADAIYTLPDVPVTDTAGHGGRYVGTYGQFRADCGLTPHIALALEAVHFLAGATVGSVGGHDTDYFGAEVRYGW
jgi:Alginate export